MDISRAIPESHPLHRLFRGLTEYRIHERAGYRRPVAGRLRGRAAGELRAEPRRSGGYAIPRPPNCSKLRRWSPKPRRPKTPPGGGNAIATSAISPCSGRGVYPEALAKVQGGNSPDALINYQQQGKRSYYVASKLSDDQDRGPVFRRLSDQFELCAMGLARVAPRVGEV